MVLRFEQLEDRVVPTVEVVGSILKIDNDTGSVFLARAVDQGSDVVVDWNDVTGSHHAVFARDNLTEIHFEGGRGIYNVFQYHGSLFTSFTGTSAFGGYEQCTAGSGGASMHAGSAIMTAMVCQGGDAEMFASATGFTRMQGSQNADDASTFHVNSLCAVYSVHQGDTVDGTPMYGQPVASLIYGLIQL